MKQVLNFPAAPVRMRILLRYRLNMYDPLSYFHFFIFVCSLVENVQWRATRFILNYLRDMSYTERLVKTNLLPLDLRREISNLLLLHKSRNGLVSTNVNNFLSSFLLRHQTRSFDPNNYNLIFNIYYTRILLDLLDFGIICLLI